MIGKLIILGIIVAALVIFVPNISKMFSTSNIKTLEQRIDQATSDKGNNGTTTAAGNTNHQTNATTPTSVDQLDPKYVDKQTYTGQVFQKTGTTCDVSVPDMAQTVNGQKELTHIIEVGQCSYSVGQPVQVTSLTAKPNAPAPVDPTNTIQIVPYITPNSNDSTPNTGGSDISASAAGYPTLPPYYQTINLNAENEGNKVVLSYDDTTGKTASVTVTLKNSDGQIFTGTFTSSQFQTEVADVPDTPHIIEMTVVNSDYGTLHGSVYAPSNNQNSIINGILSGQ